MLHAIQMSASVPSSSHIISNIGYLRPHENNDSKVSAGERCTDLPMSRWILKD